MKKKGKIPLRKKVTSKKEYETLQDKKAELEAEYRTRVWEEWSSYCREFGLPENCGLYEA
jgi:hypothetical protein